jgi:hypothetical protein
MLEETKRCPDCAKVKSLEDFSKESRNIDGRRNQCRECHNSHRKVIRSADYDELLILQGYECGICGVHESEYGKKFSVDHDHHNDLVRGLLCHGCNIAIGMLNEDIDFMKKAIGYILHHKTTIIEGENWIETQY